MNQGLNKPFTRKEVKVALRQMAPLKWPGPDGFGAYIYQQHWNTIGNRMSSIVLDILRVGSMNPSINSTFIALISKKDKLDFVNDFRPISFAIFSTSLFLKHSATV